jgi:ABC-type antimicrobial peptide transport system permease subunit
MREQFKRFVRRVSFASRLIAGVLFGVNPLDPWTFAAASLCLGAVAFAAIYVPACHAMKLDPAHVLRHE